MEISFYTVDERSRNFISAKNNIYIFFWSSRNAKCQGKYLKNEKFHPNISYLRIDTENIC